MKYSIIMIIVIVLLSTITYAEVSHTSAQIKTGSFQAGTYEFDGNIGIGTPTPTANLHVVGNARITGLSNCNIDTDANGNLICGSDAVNDADSSASNEIQSLGISGSQITISSGNAITVPYATNSDTVDGYHVTSGGTNNEANKIVKTNSNGYVNFGWINTVSGSTSQTINRIYGSGDSYIRYYTPSNFATGMANYQQRRVSSSCSAGSSIRAISSDGSVTCETDDTTGMTVAPGQTLPANCAGYSQWINYAIAQGKAGSVFCHRTQSGRFDCVVGNHHDGKSIYWYNPQNICPYYITPWGDFTGSVPNGVTSCHCW